MLVEELGVGLGVVVVEEVDELCVGSDVEEVVEPGYQSGTSSLLELDVELLAVELLEVVELELDELELLEAIELELDELELAVLDELLEVLSSGLSSPQPVRSTAARIAAKIVVFFIKNTSLKQIYYHYSTFSRDCQEKPRGHKNRPQSELRAKLGPASRFCSPKQRHSSGLSSVTGAIAGISNFPETENG